MNLALKRPENMDRTEFHIIHALLQEASCREYAITVWDSAYDEYASKIVHRSTNYVRIFNAIASDESAFLEVYQAGVGRGVPASRGWIEILWGERDTIISDYADTPEMRSLIQIAEAA
jgi:hypothetical protein